MFFGLVVLSSLFVNTVSALDRYVYSRPGESIQSIALRTGSNTFDIRRANPSLIGSNTNRIGGMVRIPGSRFDAEDVDDKFKLKFNPREITKIAGQVAQIGQVLGYDADDAEDKKINLDEIAKIAGQTQQIIQILKSDDELENGFGKKLRKLGRRISRNVRRELPKVTEIAGKVAQVGEVLGYDAEDAEDKKIRFNPSEITKIAGQVAQIGGILGFDAEDADDEIATICAVIGAVCALASTGANIYSHVKGDDEIEALEFAAEDVDDKLNWKKIKLNVPNCFGHLNRDRAKLAKVLGYDAEDVDDKFKIKFNPREITKIAGQINQIGQVLGYDAEDVDDIAVTTACAIIGAACALANTGLNIYDHVKGDDEVEELEDIVYPTSAQRIGKVIYYDADEVENKRIGGCVRPYYHHHFPRHIRKVQN